MRLLDKERVFEWEILVWKDVEEWNLKLAGYMKNEYL